MDQYSFLSEYDLIYEHAGYQYHAATKRNPDPPAPTSLYKAAPSVFARSYNTFVDEFSEFKRCPLYLSMEIIDHILDYVEVEYIREQWLSGLVRLLSINRYRLDRFYSKLTNFPNHHSVRRKAKIVSRVLFILNSFCDDIMWESVNHLNAWNIIRLNPNVPLIGIQPWEITNSTQMKNRRLDYDIYTASPYGIAALGYGYDRKIFKEIVKIENDRVCMEMLSLPHTDDEPSLWKLGWTGGFGFQALGDQSLCYKGIMNHQFARDRIQKYIRVLLVNVEHATVDINCHSWKYFARLFHMMHNGDVRVLLSFQRNLIYYDVIDDMFVALNYCDIDIDDDVL